MSELKYCPVCGIENNGRWVYLCSNCWGKFLDYLRKKYPLRTEEASKFIPKYLDSLLMTKEVVQFT